MAATFFMELPMIDGDGLYYVKRRFVQQHAHAVRCGFRITT